MRTKREWEARVRPGRFGVGCQRGGGIAVGGGGWGGREAAGRTRRKAGMRA